MAHIHLNWDDPPPIPNLSILTHTRVHTQMHWQPGCACGSRGGEGLQRWHFDDYLLLHDAAAGASGGR